MGRRAQIFVPFGVVLPALWWVIDATWRASWTTLGRDQGIFQYIAWAVRQGDVLYRDVRDVNGPVITMVHVFFQWLGGEDEHRFRVLDLTVTGASFVVAGALVAAKARRGERALWGLAAWVALSAQYLSFGFWDTAQRESFLDWFALVSIALFFAADEVRSRRGAAMVVLAGAASFLPWLGKPTFALFTVAEVLAIVLGEDRRRRFVLFALGGAAGLLVPFLFLLACGDVRAWAHITFVDVPAMYRFIWPRPAGAILSMPGYKSIAVLAVLTSLGTSALIARRVLPTRALPIALMPVLALVSMLVQAKGFPYHFHPITAGTTFAWIVAAAALRRRVPLLALAGAGAIGIHAAVLGRAAPYPPAPSPGARTTAALESAERLRWFDRIDYFPHQMRVAAAAVASSTKPTDRVQTYAMDPYLLFLARRLSATPYIYAYDLNVDAAAAGGWEEGAVRPTREQAAVIRAMRDRHAADLLARITQDPPAAFVLVSLSPLMSNTNAHLDFDAHCPRAASFMREKYTNRGGYPSEVWVRDDLLQ
ncbi:MAG: hypothetical protein KIT84_09035 [Labilithrix sp.]|nr:hypothetical protein [Labilithrix sp.]MCW5811144.1 hypothetical protein [Labilithrix sp.]